MRFTESLVGDRAVGANGHLGHGLAAEAVIRVWVAGIDERTVYEQGEAARVARVEAEPAAAAHEAAGQVAVAETVEVAMAHAA